MSHMGQQSVELVVRGGRIEHDKHGFLSLTDMWRVSGEPETKSPRRWRQLPTTRGLIAALQESDRFSVSLEENKSQNSDL